MNARLTATRSSGRCPVSTSRHHFFTGVVLVGMALVLSACPDPDPDPDPVLPAEGIFAPLGEILPTATDEQRLTFDRGLEVFNRRFTPETGLGPLFNVSFCGACHERPASGGSAGHYRDFFISGQRLDDGSFIVDSRGGVVAAYGNGDPEFRPGRSEFDNTIAMRNPIPFFGVGLIAELPESSILANADPDDADGDGISGRPNYDRGFVGRFGRKSQTVSIEGFIRGPLFNHIGLTTDPLSDELLAQLPVDSSFEADLGTDEAGLTLDGQATIGQPQAAAADEPLTDDDGVLDPELSEQDLFDLVSFAMLLAAPQAEPLTEDTLNGAALFGEVNCVGCHVEALAGPRGTLPLYSDLLLHDMGEALGDGLAQGLATGTEFRTQPLWGVAPVGPYLHDGRADTLDEAIRLHDGEARVSREAYEALTTAEQLNIEQFLVSLGGRDQFSAGLIPPGTEIPAAGEPGGPTTGLSTEDLARFETGRDLFDRDFGLGAGLGPYMNGDSCRACHFDPVVGGAGAIDVNVMRHGTWDGDSFVAPDYGTILSKLANFDFPRREHTETHNVFEPRQTPSVMGLGLIESIPQEVILARQDPTDLDADGISGVAHLLTDGRLGRFGWKGGVPSVREFIRDAMSNEMGITVPQEADLTFGFLSDADSIADPELSVEQLDSMTFFLTNLDAPHPRADNTNGLTVFENVGCGGCHVPELEGSAGPVRLFSDLLLHDVASDSFVGIPDGLANDREFRTPPLWGLSATTPFLHDGSADSVAAAIAAHAGEASTVIEAYDVLTEQERLDLLDFLNNL